MTHFTKCNYCPHKFLANYCEQHLKKSTKVSTKCCSIDIDEDELYWENEDNELSEVKRNLNDEIMKGDGESDNGSNKSDSIVEFYESDGYENA
nr:3635_t:CDS:2 [Entrophospora candida]